jgi:thiamine biosynthesis lipoprotein
LVQVPHLSSCEINLSHAAISTSGDTAQYLEIDGTRYSHTVDPRTGMGLTTRRIATVVAPDGITADGVATALTLLDQTAAEELLEHFPGARALVRRLDGADGKVEDPATSTLCRALQVPEH